MSDNDLVHNNMPRYQSRRVVRASPIVNFFDSTDHPYVEIEAGGGIHYVRVPCNFFARYVPEVGDYYLVYDDGYTSICPKASFEKGYVSV